MLKICIVCGVLAVICSGCGWQRYEVNAQNKTIVLEQYSFLMHSHADIPDKAYTSIQVDSQRR